MSRVIAGVAGGRRIAVPQGPTRPTAERVREALFSALEAAMPLAGARVLDLYAGSGALGIEALSRGAAAVLLVESDRGAAQVIRRNIDALGIAGASVVRGKVETVLSEREVDDRFDIVLADPPYALADTELRRACELLTERGWLADGAVLVVERASGGSPPWPPVIEPVREKRYGDATLYWGRATPA